MNGADNNGRHIATVATVRSGSVRSRVQPREDSEARAARERKLRLHYAELMRQYLAEPREETLLDVYRIGRAAVADELGLLTLADMHNVAVAEVLAGCGEQPDEERWQRAGVMLSELLSPYEMSTRGYREASSAMRHLNEMLEDEVRRIAHAIHDGAGQYLACVHISLYRIAKHLADEGKDEIRHAHELLDELERDLRRVSHELRPRVLENSGLPGAVEFLVDGVCKRTGLNVHVDIDLPRRPAAVVETALYRCIQEMLNNITKHADAPNAWIRVAERQGNVSCEIRDDGKGFDVEEVVVRGGGTQLGFLGIQERVAVLGGTVEISSEPGAGTTVQIQIPS